MHFSYDLQLLVNSGTRLTFQRQGSIVQISNDGTAAGLGKGNGSLNLGQHGAGSKLVLTDVLLCLGNAHLLQALLIGLAPVDGDTIHSSENEQSISMQQLSDLGGSKVLINNRGNTYQFAVLLDNGDAAAVQAEPTGNVSEIMSRSCLEFFCKVV